MTLTSLLLLAAALEADAPALGPLAVGTAGAQHVSASQLDEPFKTAPLQPGRPSLIPQREFFRLSEPNANLGYRHSGVAKLQEPAAVVCTIRVIHADPTLDAGIVRSVRVGQFDRIVRDDLAACAP
jgi:hypothetical protein